MFHALIIHKGIRKGNIVVYYNYVVPFCLCYYNLTYNKAMEEVHLQGVIVRKLDAELRVAASWDNCTLTARPGAKECSLQVKSSKYLVLIFPRFFL